MCVRTLIRKGLALMTCLVKPDVFGPPGILGPLVNLGLMHFWDAIILTLMTCLVNLGVFWGHQAFSDP